MNILILGGLGFLGRNITKRLEEKHNVYVADCINSQEDYYFKISIENTESIIEIIETKSIDVVIHLISTIIPSSGIVQYVQDIESTYTPTIKLIDYCAEKKIKFVYFSSGGAVYGNQQTIFNEFTKREPVSLYGLSKLNIENAISFFHNTKGLTYLIIRPSNPYGKGQNIYGKQGIIAVIIGKIITHKTIQIWGDGSAVKDFIYIDDLVYYVGEIIGNNESWNQIYNIGTGRGTSVNTVLDTFREIGITLPKIEFVGEKSADVKRMILDCTKLQTQFPHKCTNLKNGIKMFWEFATK